MSSRKNNKKLDVLDCAMREKYWSEMTDKEKINKLLWAVNYLNYKVQDCGLTTQKLVNHQHSKGGKLLVEFDEFQPVNNYPLINEN